MDRGHRLSRHVDVCVEQRDFVALLTLSKENMLKEGSMEATTEEKWVGDKLQKLLQNETRGVEMDGSSGSRK